MTWQPWKEKRRKRARNALAEAKALHFSDSLHWQALHQMDAGVGNDLPDTLIVSLTTFNARIDSVYLTIESLLQQSLRPDRLILWLSREEFTDSDLPALLRHQQQRGLEICFCPKDLGPYKKYVHTLERYPDALMITVDDDVLYPVDMVDKLYRAYQKAPQHIHCHRAHRMVRDEHGTIRPYREWQKPTLDSRPSLLTFPTGTGGVLYPPGSLAEQALDQALFMRLCPDADDIWLKAMSLKQSVMCQRVEEHRDFWLRFLTVEGSQHVSLKRINKPADSGNDAKVLAVFKHFGL